MSIQALTLSVPTARPTTNGESMIRTRDIFSAVLLLGFLVGTGCAWTKTTARDVQVMEAANKAETIQSQRTILELRGEIHSLQRELGAARAAQARLEGALRESQRHVAEAQRQVDIQREELAKAREERDRMAQAGREAQGQLIELGRLRQQVADAERERDRLQVLESAVEKQAKDMADMKAAAQKSAARIKPKLPNAELVVPPRVSLDRTISTGVPTMSSPHTVIVQPGDTLWDLARKHRVNLLDLITINRLVSNRIMPGQELLLPDSPAE